MRHAFGVLDWGVVLAYAGALLGIGWHYSRRQRTTEEYFVGGRSMPPFLAGVSVFAAIYSVITYVAIPGEYVQYGPVLATGVTLAILPFLQLGVSVILIPVIMRLPITSTYELFEARLGRPVRRLGSVIFIVGRLLWMALILHTGATLLVHVIGADPRWRPVIAAATGAITIAYTLVGGIRTVIVTEVVQFFVLLLGAILTLVSITIRLGGVAAWWPARWEAHWSRVPVFSLDPHVRVTLVTAFVSQLLLMFCVAGSDQASVQRFLTLRNAGAARRAYLFRNAAAAVTGVLMALTGAALLGFFRHYPGGMLPGMSFARDGDAFYPFYIGRYLPTGIAGLVVSGIMAAAMSGFSSGTSSVVTVLAKDFFEAGRSGRSQAVQLREARWLTLVVGVVALLGSIWVGSVRGDLMEVAGKTVNLLVCPLFGLFFFAVFTRFATPFGAVFSAIYSTAAAVLVAYWDVLSGRPAVSFLWMGPVSLAVSLASGTLFSLLPTRGRSLPVQAAYAAGALALLLVLIGRLL